MFRSTDIDSLKNSLAGIDFLSPPAITPLAQRYFDFYGLNFSHWGDHEVAISHHFGVFAAAGFTLACHYFRPADEGAVVEKPGGTLFILHGYYDHAGLYTHLIEFGLRQKLAVVIFDLPGHGLSSGATASIESFTLYRQVFEACLHMAKEADLPRPWHAMGQSTGGAIIMDYCLTAHRDSGLCTRQQEHQFDKVVLLAPLFRPDRWWQGRLMHALLEPFVGSVARNFARNSSDEEFLSFVQDEDPLQSKRLSAQWVRALKNWQKEFLAHAPCFARIHVIQGALDKTVDWRYNLRVIEDKFPGAAMSMIADARHHLANESEAIRGTLNRILESIFDV